MLFLTQTGTVRTVTFAIPLHSQADCAGFCRAYIVVPSTIYGLAQGSLVDFGIQNRYSIQIPKLIRAALGRGQAGQVGKGLALWPNVHINDREYILSLLISKSSLHSCTIRG